jgi:pimeloyl-ACP methyl ester carboxylesterase
VIGQSFAAGVAVWAAVESPDLVRGLVLVGPFVREIQLSAPMQALMTVLPTLLFRGPWGAAAWGAYYASLYPTAKPADFDGYRRELVANLSEPGRLAALRGLIGARKGEAGARVASVRQPALIVMGDADPDFKSVGPENEARWIAGQLGGEVVMIDGGGHYPHVELADKTNPRIVEFVRRIAP